MDRHGQQVAVAMPDRVEPLDRVIGQANDLMDDGVGHRGEDPLDVAVVFRAQLPVDEPIEVGSCVRVHVVLGHHAAHHRPPR